MTGSSYGERDYAFGQLMLTLHTTIGLTQVSLGSLLGVSWRAVAEWEGGSNYPKVERLKQLISLGVLQQVFPAGPEVEEIRALWFGAGTCVPSCGIWGLCSSSSGYGPLIPRLRASAWTSLAYPWLPEQPQASR